MWFQQGSLRRQLSLHVCAHFCMLLIVLRWCTRQLERRQQWTHVSIASPHVSTMPTKWHQGCKVNFPSDKQTDEEVFRRQFWRRPESIPTSGGMVVSQVGPKYLCSYNSNLQEAGCCVALNCLGLCWTLVCVWGSARFASWDIVIRCLIIRIP